MLSLGSLALQLQSWPLEQALVLFLCIVVTILSVSMLLLVMVWFQEQGLAFHLQMVLRVGFPEGTREGTLNPPPYR